MSSPKNIDKNTLDIGLKHYLKNWASSLQPPADGKAQLLRVAVRNAKRSKKSRAASFFLWALNDDNDNYYLEQLINVQLKFVVSGATSVH